MPEKKKLVAAATVLVMLAVSGAAFVWFVGQTAENDALERLAVYFFNSAEGRLEAEFRDLPHGEVLARANAALGYFFSEPNDANLSRAWPSDRDFSALVPRISLRDDTLIAVLSELYAEIPPPDEALFRAAFTMTMTGVPHIEGVVFRTENREWLESAETVANAPFISPARRTAEDFTLFFTDESGEGLITVFCENFDVNIHTRNRDILERLIERQSESGFLPLIPPETRVRDVLTEPDAGFYIDLSSEFHSRFAGSPAQARLMIQSITHTILENDGSNIPQRVFFLIDSDRWDEFHGVSDFNLGFVFDESFMLGFVPPPPIEE
ncbi:MAG: GerMN domain-containing protein [Defluviitaleaceae bacterium]|nr:GerMN domain-containing protein [Defluviitaleaceae bacterium]